MKRPRRNILFALCISLIASPAMIWAQEGTATDISAAAVEELLERGSGDVIMRMVDAGSVNMGIAILQYPAGDRADARAIEHSGTPEIYIVLRGEATMVTGGTIEDAVEFPADSAPARVAGPSRSGEVSGAVSRRIGPGDIVIVPPNTPHYVRDVTSPIAFMIARIDANKVMQLQ